MTEEQRKHLEERLIEERSRLVRSLERHRDGRQESGQEQSGDLSRARLHLADEGTDTFDQELEASNAARETRELGEIDEALQRLYHEPERYGRCERTGKPIPFERLDIIPWARSCEEQ